MKTIVLIICFALPFHAISQVGIITSVAGNGGAGYTGNGGLATLASIGAAEGISFDHSGNYYFVEYNNTIRKVSSSGIISTVAGTGTAGYSGDSSLATTAKLHAPFFIAIDKTDNLYFTDENNHRIRKIDAATGIITTFAGNGIGGFSGDNGPAVAASLYNPIGICIDPIGNFYITDHSNFRIRKIDTNGIITTITGNGTNIDSGDNGLAVDAAIGDSYGICTDNGGNIYFADNAMVRKIDATTGIISRFAGTDTGGHTGDNGPANEARVGGPESVTSDIFGNVFISDPSNNDIRMVDPSGVIHTIAGNDSAGFSGDTGPAIFAKLWSPRDVAVDSCGNLYVTDNGNFRIRKVTFPECGYLGLDVQNNTIAKNISIYPNPSTIELNIDNIKTGTNYVLFNIVGIIEQSGTLKPGNNQIAVQTLPPGIHILQLTDNNGQKTVKKIVKE